MDWTVKMVSDIARRDGGDGLLGKLLNAGN